MRNRINPGGPFLVGSKVSDLVSASTAQTRAPVFTPRRTAALVGGLFLAVNLLTSTLSAPAQAAPFVPPDWSAKQKAWRSTEQPQQNLLLTTLAAPVAPFVPYDWSLKPVAARLSGAWSSSTLPLFQTDPFPFAFDDWQTPPRAKPSADWQAPNLLAGTLAAPPIRITDWSGARASARSYGFEQQNLLLTTLAVAVQPAPFLPAEWAAQRLPARAQSFDPQNLLLSTLAVTAQPPPFTPEEWPALRLPSRAQGFDQQNLLLTTLAPTTPVVLPFAQYDWPSPKVAPRLYSFEPPNLALTTLALTVTPTPFAPYDWSVRPARAWQSGSWSSTILPLFRTDALPAPSVAGNTRPSAPARQSWEAPNLLTSTLSVVVPADVLPFAQYDWKLPYQTGPVVIPVEQGTPTTLLLPPGAPEPPVVEPDHPYPQPAGKSRGRPQKARRYELPNGMHVFGTANEVFALAQSMVDEPVVIRRTRPVYQVNVRLADGTKAQAKAVFPVERAALVESAQQAQDNFVEATRSAPARDIHFDAVVAMLAQSALRRRKIAMLLLLS